MTNETSTRKDIAELRAAAWETPAPVVPIIERFGDILRDFEAEISERLDAALWRSRDGEPDDDPDPLLGLDALFVDALYDTLSDYYDMHPDFAGRPYAWVDWCEPARADDISEEEVNRILAEASPAVKFIHGRDPIIAPQQSIAYNDLAAYLEGRDWVPRRTALAVMIRRSGIARRTAENRLNELCRTEILDERGSYRAAGRGRRGTDTREVKLLSWPKPGPHDWTRVISILRDGKAHTRKALEDAGVPRGRIAAAIEAGFLVEEPDGKVKRADKTP